MVKTYQRFEYLTAECYKGKVLGFSSLELHQSIESILPRWEFEYKGSKKERDTSILSTISRRRSASASELFDESSPESILENVEKSKLEIITEAPERSKTEKSSKDKSPRENRDKSPRDSEKLEPKPVRRPNEKLLKMTAHYKGTRSEEEKGRSREEKNAEKVKAMGKSFDNEFKEKEKPGRVQSLFIGKSSSNNLKTTPRTQSARLEKSSLEGIIFPSSKKQSSEKQNPESSEKK